MREREREIREREDSERVRESERERLASGVSEWGQSGLSRLSLPLQFASFPKTSPLTTDLGSEETGHHTSSPQ